MEWFEKEDFWNNYAPIMFDDAHWAEAPAVARKVMKIAELKKGSSVLDCGCGLGRISVELAALGLKVTGIDIIQSELDAAKESAEAEGVELELINADLRRFETKKQYDCSINLYTSFGYCDTVEEDMEILKNMTKPVKKGGTFILECVSRETAILYFTPGEIFERAGFTVKTEFTVQGAWEGLKSRWTLYPPAEKLRTMGTELTEPHAAGSAQTQTKGTESNGCQTCGPIQTKGTESNNCFDSSVPLESIDFSKIKPVTDHVFTQRLYTGAFLRDKLLEFGFSKAAVYGDYNFSPYDQHAQTMVVVGIK